MKDTYHIKKILHNHTYAIKVIYVFKDSHHMTWNHSNDEVNGVMVYPFDGKDWKQFNMVHPEFSMELKNVCLALCTNGFNPFGSFKLYSC
jgi:hypothetical protein